MDPRIAALKNIMTGKGLREIDEGIADILDADDPSLTSQLFYLFEDGLNHQIMFSVIHAVESLENSYYVKSFLQHLQGLLKIAPQSAGYLLVRILNHGPSVSILKEELKRNPMISKSVHDAREIALKMKADLPELT
jgi:hypothetical protein